MKKATSIEMASVLGLYVKRWQRWVAVGLQGIAIEHANDRRHLAGNQLSPNTCTHAGKL
jgi:hypothetical protein